MWKQFWKTAPLAGIMIIMILGAIGADYGLRLGYIFPKPPGQESSADAESSEETSSQESSEETSSQESSSEETSQTEESSQEASESSQESSGQSTEESSHEESSENEESSGASQESSQEESQESQDESQESQDESQEASKPSHEEHEDAFADYSPLAYVERAPAPPLSAFYDDPGRRALDTPCDYFTCDDSYFEDALFIGDSRIEGLALYGAMPTTSFLYMHGINVFTLETADDLVFKYKGALISKETTEAEALTSYQYKKIYIMLGINEMGIGNQIYFATQYAHIVETIQAYQPDAIIIIMGILNMTTEYTLGQTVFNNDNINSRNYQLALLADGEKIFYIDCNPAVWDPETEALSSAYSSDGVHLRSEYYYLWRDYLYTRAIDPEHPH